MIKITLQGKTKTLTHNNIAKNIKLHEICPIYLHISLITSYISKRIYHKYHITVLT